MAKAWTRDDALLVLAAYMDRPRGMTLPPRLEQERLAGLMRRPVDDVLAKMQAFVELAAGGTGGKADTSLWTEFGHQPLECAIAADEVMQARRRLPHHLRKRVQ